MRQWDGIAPVFSGVNYFFEPWDVLNLNWEYDGDEDLTTYPGYLAVLPPATGTFVIFTPLITSFTPWPRTTSVPVPLHIRSVYRILTNPAEIRVPLTVGFSSTAFDATNSVSVLFYWSVVENEFMIELIGPKAGVPFDQEYNTGIAFDNDMEVTIDVAINPAGFAVLVNGVTIVTQNDWPFPVIGYVQLDVGRESAIHQGMIKQTEIWTVYP